MIVITDGFDSDSEIREKEDSMWIDLETVSFSGGGNGLSEDQTQSEEIRKQNEATAWGSQKSTGTVKREKEGAEEKKGGFLVQQSTSSQRCCQRMNGHFAQSKQ